MTASTALITGASAGIGYELAKLFAHDRYNLVLVARNRDTLEQFATELQTQFGISARAVALDLTAQSAPQLLFDQLQRDGVLVDILVNNAGYGVYGEFAQMPEQEILGQIQLNITALTLLTKLFLAPMFERRSGKIMNLASTAAFQPGPLMAVYYASKAYVLSFSEALANELRGSGVTITCFCPGPTDTNFQKRAKIVPGDWPLLIDNTPLVLIHRAAPNDGDNDRGKVRNEKGADHPSHCLAEFRDRD
jgi:short-subunit dehydrogenase